jgi:high affinity sulfate transporter 1
MSARAWLRARIPVLAWAPGYEGAWFRSDLVAGVTTASVIIPKAMAYATLAGLAVQVGLYTALLPMAAYALLGSSRRLSVSTTTTIGILTAAEIAEIAPGASPEQAMTVATTLALLVGAILVLASILRLGFVAQFISEPVLTGFKAGIGIVIVVDQVPKLLGLHLAKGSVLQTATGILRALPDRSDPTLLLSLVTIGAMVLLARWVPRAPAPLIAVALGIGASGLLGLDARGVGTIGHIPSGLPSLTLPDVALLEALWPGALGIALISFTESIAAGRAFAGPGERLPDANQELLSLGLGNAAGGVFSAMPAGGGTSQTAVNARAGARTQVASLVTAGVTAAVVLFLAPLIGLMPHATLAAVVIVTSLGLIAPADFAAIRRVRTLEFRWAVAAMLGVIVLGTLPGILAAVILSMVGLLRQANAPAVYVLGRKPGTDVFRPRTPEHPEDETFPGCLVLRPEGRIYFANAQRIVDRVLAHVQDQPVAPASVVLDLSAVFDIEYTGLKALAELESALEASGCTLVFAALNPAPLEVVQRSTLGPLFGRERMFFTVGRAIEAYGSNS